MNRVLDACPVHLLSFLPGEDIARCAETSRRCKTTTREPSVWLAACSVRWPSVLKNAALAHAVRTRGAREFFERRAQCDRAVSVPTTPLCDYDDLLFAVEVEQGGKTISSVAIGARDAMRNDLEDEMMYAREDGLCFEGLSARIDATEGEFPPIKNPAFLTVSVVRMSDGRVSPFVPRKKISAENGMLYTAGRFPQYTSMCLPLSTSYCRNEFQLDIHDPDLPTSWLHENVDVQYPPLEDPVVFIKMSFGCLSEFPRDEDDWISSPPGPDPSLVIEGHHITLRRIHAHFELFHSAEDLYETMAHTRIQRLLSERLRFA